MTPIHEYLVSGLLPEDPKESRKIRVKAPQYKLIRGSLYRSSFYTPWLRCVASPQTNGIVKEIHEVSCGFNAEPCSMVKGKSDQKCFKCVDPNYVIGDCPKSSRNKDQKAFIGGSWSDSENDAEDKTNDETCLMVQSLNEVTLNSSYYSDNTSSLDNDSMQIDYDSLREISLKIINKKKILNTKRDLLEKEILELNEKIIKLERSKEIKIACKSCEELKLENAKLKKTQVKFDKSANSLREMLNNQNSPSCKIGLGFDSSKASRSGTKTMSFVGSSVEKEMDRSTIKVHGSTLPGSVSRSYGEKGT
nr:reverse transcriptase domain-containing protein [Tanacetum cinerariifolium]